MDLGRDYFGGSTGRDVAGVFIIASEGSMSQATRLLPKLDRDEQKEARLGAIQREAALRLEPRSGAPTMPSASPEEGYYGLPLLKEPTWTWEIPLYLFVGGTAGTAGVLSAIGRLTHAPTRLSAWANWRSRLRPSMNFCARIVLPRAWPATAWCNTRCGCRGSARSITSG